MKPTVNRADDQKSNIAQLIWPLVILLLGMILTGVVWLYASIKDDEKSQAAFDLHARDASRDIQNRIKVYFGVLHSAGGFFAGSKSVSRAEWEQFVNFIGPKTNYPGIEGMGVIRYVANGQKSAFENASKREIGHKNSPGSADYTIRPPGMREAYYPVEYFWPASPGINLPGLDHGAYPDGLKALEKARDSGLVTITRQLPYAQGNDRTPPILFLRPIYRNGLPSTTVEERRKAVYGFAYARINVENLFHDVISPSIIQEIYLEVFDGGDSDQEITRPDKAHLIFDADQSDTPHALDTSHQPRHHVTQKVALNGSTWLFYTSSQPGGVIEQRDSTPLFILFTGSLLSIGASAINFLRNRQKQLIQRYAHYDHLTGLPNRRLLQDRFQQALAHAKRYGTGMALLFLDLDHFKPINDSLGHAAGDKVLKAVSDRLTSCLRESDTIARTGGDEFAILLLNIYEPEDASLVAQKIIENISEPIPVKGQNLRVGCSIGISIFPKGGADYDALLKNADAALYCAKENGRNNFQFYTG